MEAAAALTLAVLYGVVGAVDRRNLSHLTLCVVAISMAVVARAELGMMHASTAAAYGEWMPWCYLPGFFAVVGQVLFVHLYLGTGRSDLLWSIIGIRLLVLVGNFF